MHLASPGKSAGNAALVLRLGWNLTIWDMRELQSTLYETRSRSPSIHTLPVPYARYASGAHVPEVCCPSQRETSGQRFRIMAHVTVGVSQIELARAG